MGLGRVLPRWLTWCAASLLGCTLAGGAEDRSEASAPSAPLVADQAKPAPVEENPPLELVDHGEERPYVYFECAQFDVPGCAGAPRFYAGEDDEPDDESVPAKPSKSQKTLAKVHKQLAAACPKLSLADLDKIDVQAEEYGLGHVESRTRGDHLIVTWWQNYGQGVYDHYDETRYYIYDTDNCTVLEITEGYTGWLMTSVHAGSLSTPFSARSIEAELLGEWADCSDPRHGFACMYLRWPYQGANESLDLPESRDWELVSITREPGPWVAGKIVAQVPTYWTEEERARHLVVKPTPDPEDPDGYVVLPAKGAKQVGKVGKYRLFESELAGRGTPLAFAVEEHDGRVRHRWIAHTREGLLADYVDWLLFGDDLMVGFAGHTPLGPTRSGIDGLFVVDLANGMIHRLLVRELVAMLDIDSDESAVEQDLSFDNEEIRERVRVDGDKLRIGKLELTTAMLRERIEAP